jgi:hypothetical protein
MSDYTLAVSWSGKDALSDSDAGKVISGADFNSEFTTIQTALNSKADIASETLTGIPLAPTATVGTDTTQIATTAFVQASANAAVINNLVYPVGSIYFNMAVSTNPATLLGMGTWVAYGEGRVLVGKQSSGTFDALDESLGAETASSGSHTLTTAEMPSHTHTLSNWDGGGPYHYFRRSGGHEGVDGVTGATGGGGGHSHTGGSTLQPSVTVYMWKRTA